MCLRFFLFLSNSRTWKALLAHLWWGGVWEVGEGGLYNYTHSLSIVTPPRVGTITPPETTNTNHQQNCQGAAEKTKIKL